MKQMWLFLDVLYVLCYHVTLLNSTWYLYISFPGILTPKTAR